MFLPAVILFTIDSTAALDSANEDSIDEYWDATIFWLVPKINWSSLALSENPFIVEAKEDSTVSLLILSLKVTSELI